MSRYLAGQLQRNPGVEILHHAEIRELVTDGELRGVIAEDKETAERRTLEARALFVFIGAGPQVGWLGDQLALDDDGFVLTGRGPRGRERHEVAARPRSFSARDRLAWHLRSRGRSKWIGQAGDGGHG